MRVSYRGNQRVIRGGGGSTERSTMKRPYTYYGPTEYFRVVTPYVNRNETFTHCRVILSPANWLSYDATTTKRARFVTWLASSIPDNNYDGKLVGSCVGCP